MSGFGADVEAFGGGFFDRVSGASAPRETCDVEVQDCHSQLRMCMQRIADVEVINIDLEARLEAQAREYIELESDAAESLASWKSQYEAVVEEAENWRHLHAQQELKNQKIREQLLRTERELHGILQKKYDIMEFARREERDRMRAEQSMGGGRMQTLTLPALPRTSDSELVSMNSTDHFPRKRDDYKNGYDNHNPLGAPPQDVRRGRAVLALADFFGLHYPSRELPVLPGSCAQSRPSRHVPAGLRN